jgi:N-acetylglucosaminyldiphosphoundecaprenol N-acetyl-beta-D-mannosaminyltransferase
MEAHPAQLELERTNVLGVGVSAINLPLATNVILGWISSGTRHYVCVTGVHGVMECQRDADLLRIHRSAGMVTPDGMPMVWLSKLAGHRHVDRVYGPDLMHAVFAAGVTMGLKHFLYGATEETLAKLRTNLLAAFPDARIAGTYSPPFRPVGTDETKDVCDHINQSDADIVWVGLSTPKQEVWMARHRDRLRNPVLIGVGAAFDIHAGTLPQAPRFMQRSGLEWAFRLAQEPRRLASRYLRNNPLFVLLVLKQYLRRGWSRGERALADK